MALTVFLAAVAVVTFVRVENLWASTVWLILNGPRWQELTDALSNEEMRDPITRWECYAGLGGGKLPFLLVGVKGYRVRAWAARNQRARPCRSRLARWLARIWSWYVYSPALALVVIVLALVPTSLSNWQRYCLVATAVLAVIGQISIAVEGNVAKVVLRSWAHDYHRVPYPRHMPHLAKLWEIAIVLGSLALAWLSAFALVTALTTRFSAYGGVPSGATALSLETAFGLTITAVFSNAWALAAGTAGFLGNLLLFLLYASFVAGLFVKP